MSITYPPEMLPSPDEGEEADVLVACPVCNTDGKVEIPDPQRDDPYYARVMQCMACSGSGWVIP